MRRQPDKYRTIFEHSAVSLWEEDIAAVRRFLGGLRVRGASDLGAWLDAHPEQVDEAVRSIEVVDVNAATLELFEARRKEDLLGPLSVTLDHAERESFKQVFMAIFQGQRDHQSESSIQTQSGKRLAVLVRSHIPAPQDAYPYMLVSIVDVTERKRLEQSLVAERNLLRTVVDNLPDRIYIKDRQSRFVLVNRALAELLDLPDAAQLIGKTDHDFFEKRLAIKFMADEQDIMASGRGLFNIVEEAGEQQWSLTTKVPLTGADGAVTGIIGIGRDFTALRQAQEKNLRLAALVEASDDAIVAIDLDRRITVWNRGAERIYGYSAAEVMGQHTSLLIPTELEGEARRFWEMLTRGERIEHYETVRKRKDGSLIDVSLTLFPVQDSAGKTIELASVARDVTGQVALQRRLNRAQRLESLGTLAGGIAHRFNNINAIIAGNVDLMIRDGRLPEELRAYARDARAGVDRAIEVTDRLLTLTRTPPDPLGDVRVDELARLALAGCRARIDAGAVSVREELAESTAAAVYASRLSLVLSALIDNALDAVLDRKERVLTVRTGADGLSVFVEVIDTGCGIAREDMPRIFSPFFTMKGEWAPPGSSQAQVKGLGLSLAIAHATITGFGGTIEVASAPEGGTTFRVMLRRAGGPSVAPTSSP